MGNQNTLPVSASSFLLTDTIKDENYGTVQVRSNLECPDMVLLQKEITTAGLLNSPAQREFLLKRVRNLPECIPSSAIHKSELVSSFCSPSYEKITALFLNGTLSLSDLVQTQSSQYSGEAFFWNLVNSCIYHGKELEKRMEYLPNINMRLLFISKHGSLTFPNPYLSMGYLEDTVRSRLALLMDPNSDKVPRRESIKSWLKYFEGQPMYLQSIQAYDKKLKELLKSFVAISALATVGNTTLFQNGKTMPTAADYKTLVKEFEDRFSQRASGFIKTLLLQDVTHPDYPVFSDYQGITTDAPLTSSLNNSIFVEHLKHKSQTIQAIQSKGSPTKIARDSNHSDRNLSARIISNTENPQFSSAIFDQHENKDMASDRLANRQSSPRKVMSQRDSQVDDGDIFLRRRHQNRTGEQDHYRQDIGSYIQQNTGQSVDPSDNGQWTKKPASNSNTATNMYTSEIGGYMNSRPLTSTSVSNIQGQNLSDKHTEAIGNLTNGTSSAKGTSGVQIWNDQAVPAEVLEADRRQKEAQLALINQEQERIKELERKRAEQDNLVRTGQLMAQEERRQRELRLREEETESQRNIERKRLEEQRAFEQAKANEAEAIYQANLQKSLRSQEEERRRRELEQQAQDIERLRIMKDKEAAELQAIQKAKEEEDLRLRQSIQRAQEKEADERAAILKKQEQERLKLNQIKDVADAESWKRLLHVEEEEKRRKLLKDSQFDQIIVNMRKKREAEEQALLMQRQELDRQEAERLRLEKMAFEERMERENRERQAIQKDLEGQILKKQEEIVLREADRRKRELEEQERLRSIDLLQRKKEELADLKLREERELEQLRKAREQEEAAQREKLAKLVALEKKMAEEAMIERERVKRQAEEEKMRVARLIQDSGYLTPGYSSNRFREKDAEAIEGRYKLNQDQVDSLLHRERMSAYNQGGFNQNQQYPLPEGFLDGHYQQPK